MTRSCRAATLVLAACLALAACAVPNQRDDLTLDKSAATGTEVDAVFTRYRDVRNTAIELLDPQPLSTVESGAVLAIDTGSFEVSQRLDQTQRSDTPIDVTTIETPRFDQYPLWFYAVVRDDSVNRVQVFARETAVDPWLLVATPETLADTDLPELRRGGGDAVLTVAPDDGRGMAMSAQAAAEAYAGALADESSEQADAVETDSFITQMRETAEQNAALDDVDFSQSWGAEDVEYALRTSDGGTLAFVTLLREDAYDVPDGLTVTWPDGSPQEAFLSSGISSSGTLRYFHQVLMYVPGGSDKPRVLGQYGGVVSGEGD